MIPGSMYKNSALYAPGSAGKSDIVVVEESQVRYAGLGPGPAQNPKSCRRSLAAPPLCHHWALTLYFRYHRECILN
jgi:hypothetical protein